MAGTLQVRSADKKLQKLKLLDLRVDIQISTAFVAVTSEWFVGKDGWYSLEIPMNPNSSITHIEITTGNILIQSAIIPEEEFKVYFRSPQSVEYDHDLFNFPFELKGGGHSHHQLIRVFVTYFEPMSFDDSTRQYSFTFPMQISDGIVEKHQIPVLHAQAIINTATDKFQWGSARHPLQVVSHGSPTSIALDCRDFYPRINQDFEINYTIITNEILCTLLVNEANLDPYDPRQTFCVNLHPPPESALQMGSFGRRIVFLIDVSGSMTGEPLQQAITALCAGLQMMMKPTDHFTIVAFNHAMSFFHPELVHANPQSIDSAKEWVRSLAASGGTNIMAPVQCAMDLLNKGPALGQIPMIFLLTDGAVDNEVDIFHWVAANCAQTRIHTLGIGKCCNAYFLKMVALAGRGLNDQIMTTRNIQTQFFNMLRSANTPILTNVEVLLPVQNSQYEVFPNPIPDLFCGNPLVISGKSGQFFDHALIRGNLPGGIPFQTKVYPLVVPIYLHGIFVKQRLDYLVGQAWLTKDLGIKQQAIDLSCKAHIPSPYTTMVGYSVPPNKRPTKQLTTAEISALCVGGVVAIVGIGMTLGSVLDSGLITSVVSHAMGGGGGHYHFGTNHGAGNGPCDCCSGGHGHCCNCHGCCDCGSCHGCTCNSCNCGSCNGCDCHGCSDSCKCGDCGSCNCANCGNCNCNCGDCGACNCGNCGNCNCGNCGNCNCGDCGNCGNCNCDCGNCNC